MQINSDQFLYREITALLFASSYIHLTSSFEPRTKPFAADRCFMPKHVVAYLKSLAQIPDKIANHEEIFEAHFPL